MPHDEKERGPANRWSLYNDCADVIARLATIIPRVLAERVQAPGISGVLQQVASTPGRWPLYNDCANEIPSLLARINECLREDLPKDE